MNVLMKVDGVQTMGTSEIAKLIGKRHADIKRSYKNLFDKGLMEGGTDQAHPFKTNDGQLFYEFRLNQRNSIILVAQNCPEFTAVLVDRWQELEDEINKKQTPQKSIPGTYAEALLEAGRLALEVEKQQLMLEEQKPSVQFCEQVSQAKNDLLIRDFAKALSKDGFKIGQNKLFEWLRQNKILMSNNQPYQRFIDNGYFNVVTRLVQTNSGTITKYTPMVTGKGQIALSKKLLVGDNNG